MERRDRQRYLNQTFMRIPRRAENTDRSTLAETYVSAGSFSAMLHSTDHQVLYGRRGTGKTHALHHLGNLIESTGDLLIYLDLRTIGSTGEPPTADATSLAARGTQLLGTYWRLSTTNYSHYPAARWSAYRSDCRAFLAEQAQHVVPEVERDKTTITGTKKAKLAFELSASPSVKIDCSWRYLNLRPKQTATQRGRTSSDRVWTVEPSAARHNPSTRNAAIMATTKRKTG